MVSVAIVAIGSRGDVAPYTGLGVRLQAAGHNVTVATHAVFEPLVRRHGLGSTSCRWTPRSTCASGSPTAA
ncbi:glycosyltransferase [Dactylosporangium vinaceum]|uniref:Glycosyltransferase n=1 Tax=Dactylosporangium vinaceum TaxID=53362 RepID=A0ABV5MLA7_9ACTN|nr:glycosyltransferase [Dactylosporangium vinaceum]